MTTPADLLRQAKALIEDPAHWTKGAYAQNCCGITVVTYSPEACRWCAAGALMHIEGGGFKVSLAPKRFLSQAAFLGFGRCLEAVNDDLGHAAVMQVYDLAIQLAEQEEAQ